MMSNSIFVGLNSEEEAIGRVLVAIYECATHGEEQCTFNFQTPDTELIKRITDELEAQGYITETYTWSETLEGEGEGEDKQPDFVMTMFYVKVKWENRFFTEIPQGPQSKYIQ